jgi:hypothetical protein
LPAASGAISGSPLKRALVRTAAPCPRPTVAYTSYGTLIEANSPADLYTRGFSTVSRAALTRMVSKKV